MIGRMAPVTSPPMPPTPIAAVTSLRTEARDGNEGGSWGLLEAKRWCGANGPCLTPI